MADLETISDSELLSEVRKAIRTVLIGGQSYQIGSRKLTRANLAELRDLAEELEAAVNSSDSTLIDDTYVAVFEGR